MTSDPARLGHTSLSSWTGRQSQPLRVFFIFSSSHGLSETLSYTLLQLGALETDMEK